MQKGTESTIPHLCRNEARSRTCNPVRSSSQNSAQNAGEMRETASPLSQEAPRKHSNTSSGPQTDSSALSTRSKIKKPAITTYDKIPWNGVHRDQLIIDRMQREDEIEVSKNIDEESEILPRKRKYMLRTRET